MECSISFSATMINQFTNQSNFCEIERNKTTTKITTKKQTNRKTIVVMNESVKLSNKNFKHALVCIFSKVSFCCFSVF